ncbi:hypothetical protein [Hymenobacter sp. BRD67]|uniref:hypothetical protein n=1 Tax=Hymenobacter sp. BRD67 TaxID=2675877 RepID=UPI00293BB402|nr:hypothetical protein [Hymenobacter sp. BRD67]
MNIILGTAEHDFCKEANYRMSDILARKGIAHRLDVRPTAPTTGPCGAICFRTMYRLSFKLLLP